MRNKALDKGKPTDIYDEPDPGTGDKEVCRRLTAELNENADLTLPDGYKIATEKTVEISHEKEFTDESTAIAY